MCCSVQSCNVVLKCCGRLSLGSRQWEMSSLYRTNATFRDPTFAHCDRTPDLPSPACLCVFINLPLSIFWKAGSRFLALTAQLLFANHCISLNDCCIILSATEESAGGLVYSCSVLPVSIWLLCNRRWGMDAEPRNEHADEKWQSS